MLALAWRSVSRVCGGFPACVHVHEYVDMRPLRPRRWRRRLVGRTREALLLLSSPFCAKGQGHIAAGFRHAEVVVVVVVSRTRLTLPVSPSDRRAQPHGFPVGTCQRL